MITIAMKYSKLIIAGLPKSFDVGDAAEYLQPWSDDHEGRLYYGGPQRGFYAPSGPSATSDFARYAGGGIAAAVCEDAVGV